MALYVNVRGEVTSISNVFAVEEMSPSNIGRLNDYNMATSEVRMEALRAMKKCLSGTLAHQASGVDDEKRGC